MCQVELRQEVRDRVMSVVRGHFRPEFLNRLDDIVIFQPLSREQLREIMVKQMEAITERLKDRNIEVQVSGEGQRQVLLRREGGREEGD